MRSNAELPNDFIIDGKPYWEELGGQGVVLVGSSAGLFMNGPRGFRAQMRQEGHIITSWWIDSLVGLTNQIEEMYEGEVGAVVVAGKLGERRPGDSDVARIVPGVLAEMCVSTQVIFSDIFCASEATKKILLERGYDAVVEDDHSLDDTPSSVIPDTARKVTELTGNLALLKTK